MSEIWPTLTTGAQRENFRQFPITDPTVRSMTLDGRPLARSGVQPMLYGWAFTLRYLSVADKEALESLQETTRVGGDTIEWDDQRPSSDSGGTVGTHTVRLAEPMEFDLDDDGFGYRTDVSLHQEPGT